MYYLVEKTVVSLERGVGDPHGVMLSLGALVWGPAGVLEFSFSLRSVAFCRVGCNRDTHAYRETDRHTNRDRQTHTHTDTQTHTFRHIHRHTSSFLCFEAVVENHVTTRHGV